MKVNPVLFMSLLEIWDGVFNFQAVSRQTGLRSSDLRTERKQTKIKETLSIKVK